MKSLVGLFAISITIFSLIGCTSGVTVKSTNPLHDGITVMKLTLIEDHYGGQHIVGEIRNDASFPLKSIKLSISITDTDGETVLKDSDEKPITEDSFSPFLGNPPDLNTPFPLSQVRLQITRCLFYRRSRWIPNKPMSGLKKLIFRIVCIAPAFLLEKL
jgi:hypothetical protein